MFNQNEDHCSESELFGSLFEEPESYFKPKPKPHIEVFQRKNGDKISVRLVGSHPLWGHELWNASRVLAEYLDSQHCHHLLNKCILELGAGGGLPSLISTFHGALRVVITDFPERELLDNIQYNVNENIPKHLQQNVIVIGHEWGKDINKLIDVLKPINRTKYDLILCSDLIFNHSAHNSLLRTIDSCLSEDGLVFLTFTHHRPWLMEKDLSFFTIAQLPPFNFLVDKIMTKEMWPMFPQDPGSVEIRQQVHLYTLRRNETNLQNK